MENFYTSLLTFENEATASSHGVVHPSLSINKVIHIDMDAFYASIEERDNPSLKGCPVVVGGSPTSRGVVATCNYEARQFGIRSAMACSKAYRLCSKAVFVRPRFEVYSAVSRQVKEILLRYSEKVEMLSLDEGFVDVTTDSNRSATEIAMAIKADINEVTKLSCSAGVAPNKMLAKIATDFNKPNGLTVLKPSQVYAFMRPLPLAKIPFVGPKSQARLKARGWLVCSDLMDAGKSKVVGELGEWGFELWDRIHGLDISPVSSFSERKSLGEEHTYPVDIADEAIVMEKLQQIAVSLMEDVQKRNLSFCNLTLKVKTADFKTITRSLTAANAFCDATEIFRTASILWRRAHIHTPIRLLGLSASQFSSGLTSQQMRMFDEF